MHCSLKRQEGPEKSGYFEEYTQKITTEASFLEMIDLLNEDLNSKGLEPVAIESDCREGICGTCGVMINGQAHGPRKATTTCQLHMREFLVAQGVSSPGGPRGGKSASEFDF